MRHGFYEQLGAPAGASLPQLRSAYAEAVAELSRRRKALLAEGGDAARIDLVRAQLDEAWEVLSVPGRRRRYDAMVALTHHGKPEVGNLWDQAAGAMIPPAVQAAVELLRVSTNLKIGVLPPAPGPVSFERLRAEEPTLTATSPTMVPMHSGAPTDIESTASVPPPIGMPRPRAPVVSLPTVAKAPPARELHVVDGTPSASSVIVLPTAAPLPEITDDQLASLIALHGYSGALLRAVREARKIDVQEMSDNTRISVSFLEAIEADRHDALPSATFVRGYVREMARMLQLDTDTVVAGYMRRL